jgi:hypothetical protein
MSDLNLGKSKLQKLAEPDPPANEKLKIDPLADVNLFEQKKDDNKNIKIIVEEKTQVAIEEPLVKEKKPRKKRVLTEAHKARLAAGRLKGLQTRRRKKLEKEALKAGKPINTIEASAPAPAPVAPIARVNVPVARVNVPVAPITRVNVPVAPVQQIKVAKQLINNPIKMAAAQTAMYKKNNDPYDEDRAFKRFYSHMSKYERIRSAQIKKENARLVKEQKERQTSVKTRRPVAHTNTHSYGYSNRNSRMKKHNTTGAHDYLQYFT